MKCAYILLLAMNLVCHIHPNDKERLRQVVSQMTDEDKAAALIIAASISNEEKNKKTMEGWKEWQPEYHIDQKYVENLIVNHNIGGVIFYGGNTSPQEQKELTQHYQSLSKKGLIIALDIETSLSNRLDRKSVIKFPCAMTLGAVKDKKLLKKLGYELGLQLKQLNVNWAYGPVADVDTREENPIINFRSFGSDPQNVSKCIIAIMKGLQAAGIYACAKHFPGHGDTSDDSHTKLPKIVYGMDRLAIDLKPFKQVIKAGIKSVMTAHLEVPALDRTEGKPSSLSHNIVTKLLKHTLRFKGLVVTDALGMKGASEWAPPGELEVQALMAGNDVLLCPVNPVAAIQAIVHALKTGRLSQAELDKKVIKVLKAKAQMRRQEIKSENIDKVLQSKEAKQLKKELYAQAITLAKAKKENPFDKPTDAVTIVISDTQHTTFESQLNKHEMINCRFPQDVSKEALTAFADNLKKPLKDHQHIIISLHDMSWRIDENYNINPHIFGFIDRLKAMGKQVTVVLFGSPYGVKQFKNADNIVVAYEPDEDAQEVAADVICGMKKAPGVLPVTLEQ